MVVQAQVVVQVTVEGVGRARRSPLRTIGINQTWSTPPVIKTVANLMAPLDQAGIDWLMGKLCWAFNIKGGVSGLPFFPNRKACYQHILGKCRSGAQPDPTTWKRMNFRMQRYRNFATCWPQDLLQCAQRGERLQDFQRGGRSRGDLHEAQGLQESCRHQARRD